MDPRFTLHEARRLDPEEVTTHVRLGEQLVRAERTEEAIASYREALRLDSTHFNARYNLGALLHQTGRTKLAIEAFREATRSDTRRPESWRKLMSTGRSVGDPETRRAAALRLLDLDPNDLPALLAATLASLDLGQDENALPHLRRAWARDEARVEARAKQNPKLGRLLERRGDR